MKKIIFLFIGVLLLYSANVFAQSTTMEIGKVPAAAGTVVLPVNVANFNNVGAISLKISYDASALTFVGIANSPSNVTFTKNDLGGTLMLSWFDATASSPINITNGKLVDLEFTSNGHAGNVNFVTTGINACDIADESGNSLVVGYTNGGVTSGPTLNLSVVSVSAVPGNAVSVALNSQHLNNVGAISLKIAYNTSVLTFTGVANAPSGVTFTSNAANGVISISWFDQTGTHPLNMDLLSKLLDLNFTYNGGTSALAFDVPNCDISDSLGVKYTNVNYTNGSVHAFAGSTPALQLATVTSASGSVSVPLTVTGFDSVGAISLKIDYNSSALSFTNVTTTLSGVTFTASASNGVVSISWFDQTGTTPLSFGSGTLLKLNFTYNGGTSTLAFDTLASEISTSTGSKIIGVTYANGSVSNSTSVPTLTLSNVSGTIGSVVSVPVTVQGLSNIGAISLKINYDATALTFDSVSNAPAGVTFTANASNGVLSIGWFDQTTNSPINLDGGKTLLKINFKYNGGISTLAFNKTLSELTNESGVALTNVVYVNGSVSSSGPTVIAANVIAPVGTVIVPIVVKKFSSVGAISLKIDYDANVLSNPTLINPATGLTFTSNASNGVFAAGWFDATGTTPFNGDSVKLFDISFTYSGGTSNLNFDLNQSEIANSAGIKINDVVFVNGSVRSGVAPTVSLPNVHSIPNANLSIPLTFKKFSGIGAVSIKVQYNAAVLNFTGVTNTTSSKIFTADANNGVLTIGWFDQSGTSPITADSASLVKLNFTYLGGTSNLTFLSNGQSEIADSAANVIGGVIYVNGSVYADQAPVFTKVLPDSTTLIAKQLFQFTYVATDADGDSLSYSLVKGPAGSSIGTKTGVFSWTPDTTHVGKTDTVIVAVSDGLLSVDTMTVLHKTITGIVVVHNPVPTSYNLSQNYPNPFNPSTSINFDVPKESKVILKVFNILGQEVVTLVNQTMKASSYTYKFDATNLPSGIYIYRLQAGDYTLTKKMTLLK